MRNPALKRFQLTREEYQDFVRASMAAHRLEILERHAPWVHKNERHIQRYLIRGADVDVTRIRPRLELVTTNNQRAIWRYCRLWGSIPYQPGCGRRLLYLLRDEGQPNAPIMGIIGLASPIILNKPRDQWIKWQYPRDVECKRRRLLTCMDMTVSMAVEPYNHLIAGKMICLAVLSNELRQDYATKYEAVQTPSGMQEGRLALITTTSLYGSSIQYNRLRVDDRLAYKMVGYTSGHGNAHLTEAEFAAMEAYLESIGRSVRKGWGTGRSYRLRVLTAYRRYGYDAQQAAPHKQTRSVYVAPLASNTEAFLREEEDTLHGYNLPFEQLVNEWRQRWLTSRLGNPDTMHRFRTANPFARPLSTELTPALV